MADDGPITIEIVDKVDAGVQAKIEGIGKAARDSGNAVNDLKSQLKLLNSSPSASLKQAVDDLTGSLKTQISTQRTATTELQASKATQTEAITLLQQLAAQNNAVTAAKDAGIAKTIAAASAENKLLTSIQTQAETYGKSKSELLAYRAAQLGLTAEAAPFITKLKQAEDALNNNAHAHQVVSTQAMALQHAIRGSVEQLAQGVPITQVMAQQLNHLSYAATGPGGLSGAFKSAFGMFAGLISPSVVAIGTVVVALGVLVFAWQRWLNLTADTGSVVNGAGRALGYTVDQFNDLAVSAATAGDISISQSIGLANALARTGQLGAENISTIIGLSKNLSKTLGTDFAETEKILTKTFSDPQKGIESLNAQLNFLDASTSKTVRSLIAQGQAQAAIKLALDKLPAALATNEQSTTQLGRAWDAVTTAASNYFSVVGRGIDRGLGGSVPITEQIDALNNRINAELQNAGSMAKGDPVRANLLKAIKDLQAQRDALLAKSLNQAADAAQKADDATLNKTSQAISGVVDTAAPASEELRKLKDELALVNQAAANDNLKLKVGDLQQLTEATDALNRAVTSYLSAADKQTQTNAIDIQLINARTSAQRAELSQRRTAIELAGKTITSAQADNAIRQAGLVITTQATKERADENLQLDRTLALFGQVGPARQLSLDLLNRELSARRSGNAYSPAELTALENKLRLTQQFTDVQTQLDRIYNDSVKPQKDLTDTIAAANSLLSQGVISWQQYADAITQAKIKALDAENTIAGGLKSGLLSVQNDLNNVGNTVKTGVTSVFGDAENAVVNFAQTGKFNMANFTQAIEGDLVRVAFRLLVVRQLMNGLGSLFGGVAAPAGLGTAGNSMTGGAGDPTGGGKILTPAAGGADGIVPGMYSGRDTHLQPVAAGERVTVQTPAQQRAAASGDGGGSSSAPIIQVITPPGATVQQKQSTQDGQSLTQLVISAVKQDYANGGFDTANSSRYGVSPLVRRTG